jgi:1,4-dihydroxy-2-naphthoate octaprenyltransferase
MQAEINFTLVLCCLSIATFGHISVNLFNEYYDAKSGLDESTQKTPFSGGSGALQQNPAALNAVKQFGIISLLIVVVLGVYIASQVHLLLSVIGLIGIAIVLAYTPWLNQKTWLCLIAPGFGFGFLMVVGTYAALTGAISLFAICISLPVFCLVNNLLLLNQFPDVLADQSVGRKHFVIRYGYKGAALAYFGFVMVAYFAIVILTIVKLLPVWSLFALIGLPIGLLVALKASQYEPKNVKAFLPFMGINVMLTLGVPLILAITLFFA